MSQSLTLEVQFTFTQPYIPPMYHHVTQWYVLMKDLFSGVNLCLDMPYKDKIEISIFERIKQFVLALCIKGPMSCLSGSDPSPCVL